MKYIVTEGSQWFITSNDMSSENLLNEIKREVQLRNWDNYTYKEYVEEINDNI